MIGIGTQIQGFTLDSIDKPIFLIKLSRIVKCYNHLLGLKRPSYKHQ